MEREPGKVASSDMYSKTDPAKIIADPMEYEDDEGLENLFVSHKIELLLKNELKKDVDAKHYLQFQQQLDTDLIAMSKEGSLEDVKKYINTKLGKFGSGAGVQSNGPTSKPGPGPQAVADHEEPEEE